MCECVSVNMPAVRMCLCAPYPGDFCRQGFDIFARVIEPHLFVCACVNTHTHTHTYTHTNCSLDIIGHNLGGLRAICSFRIPTLYSYFPASPVCV
jgi:hypothetical protein